MTSACFEVSGSQFGNYLLEMEQGEVAQRAGVSDLLKLEEGGDDIGYLKIGECGQRQDLQFTVA